MFSAIGLPGVLFVLPDSYVDPEYKDYGGKRSFSYLLIKNKIFFEQLFALCLAADSEL